MCILCEQSLAGSLSTGRHVEGKALYGLSIAPAELIDEVFVSVTRNVTATDGIMDYYLHEPGGKVTVAGGSYNQQSIQSVGIPGSDVDFFNSMVQKLDAIIDLDFRKSLTASQADVDLYYDVEIDLGDDDVLGLATTDMSSGWELFIDYPKLQNDQNYLRYILIHEFGHSLGLEHPFENKDGDAVKGIIDPWNSSYPEETVMAYRSPKGNLWPDFFTDNDLNALIHVWGAEHQWLTYDSDVIFGAKYSEKISGLSGDDRIIGAGGADVINGNQGNDWLQGAFGRDQLFGGSGDDILRGGNASDRLNGGGGADLLVGGGGKDTLTGGAGSDRFRLGLGDDIITDFSIIDGDKIEIESSLNYLISSKNGEVHIFNDQGSLTLAGVFDFDPESQLSLL
ncbi:hypothetical protein [Synechococcus sp. GEYO]|uniref:hypothetical protein n=1 Tax=Synechococcus sp. GEYO TaxID=2575511 RepID=UPI000E0E29BC|nr:hypothetical protein [Synechococcus sp. GEYO]